MRFLASGKGRLGAGAVAIRCNGRLGVWAKEKGNDSSNPTLAQASMWVRAVTEKSASAQLMKFGEPKR